MSYWEKVVLLEDIHEWNHAILSVRSIKNQWLLVGYKISSLRKFNEIFTFNLEIMISIKNTQFC